MAIYLSCKHTSGVSTSNVIGNGDTNIANYIITFNNTTLNLHDHEVLFPTQQEKVGERETLSLVQVGNSLRPN